MPAELYESAAIVAGFALIVFRRIVRVELNRPEFVEGPNS